MALDSSLFTLTFQRRTEDACLLDLVPFHPSAAASSSSSSQPCPLYSFSRARSLDYDVQLVDHLTGIPLSSIAAPSSADKLRTIQLYNPHDSVVFEKRSMTFRQEWRWTWQEQEYLVRKDGRSYIVEALRKPDPEIDVARYTPATKARPAFLQVLDYNIQRLEVSDRRGLEVLLLTAVCTLLDLEYDEKYRDGPSGNVYLSGATPASSSLAPTTRQGKESTAVAQAPGEANEIVIDMHTPNDVYVRHALQLMRQDEGGQGLHIVVLKASQPQLTPKAVQIAAEVKARWYRLEAVAKGRTLDPLPGSTSEIAEELYQYVRDPSLLNPSKKGQENEPKHGELEAKTGPRPRIKLDAPAPPQQPAPPQSPPGKAAARKSFAPPSQLDIYLSKERIDEFEVGLPAGPSAVAPLRPHVSNPEGVKTPVIPPKGAAHGKQQSDHQHTDSTGGARKILGKLGLRKSHAEGPKVAS